MLHELQEPETRTFSAPIRRNLNKYAEEIGQAKDYADMADRIRGDTRGALVDIFGVCLVGGGSTAYRMDSGLLADDFLCLDLAVRYTADMTKLARTLGNRMEFVVDIEPVFNRKKAEAALAAGIINETELARCMTVVPRTSAVIRAKSSPAAPKGIQPGEARMTPLKLVKPLKLNWTKGV